MASSETSSPAIFPGAEGANEQDPLSYASQLVNSMVLPMSLHAAAELDLFEILAGAGPGAELSAAEIAARMPTKNPAAAAMVDRILRLLASHEVVSCRLEREGDGDGDGGGVRVYGLTAVSRYFARNEDGVSLGPLIALIQDKVFLDSWAQLKDSVLEGGIPFNRVHGANAFEYPDKDPRFNQVFNKAMLNHTTIVIKNILQVYKGFESLKKLVDVGGGLGVSIGFITSKYPSIKGVNYDLPHVVKDAPTYPGVEHVGGDMFESVPEGDAIFMKWILHDWSDDYCLKLLKNCYRAIPANGKVIVMESVLPVVPETTVSVKCTAQIDVLMMTQNPGGKERTKEEFTALATGAGFQGIRFECFVCNFWVMEFFK